MIGYSIIIVRADFAIAARYKIHVVQTQIRRICQECQVAFESGRAFLSLNHQLHTKNCYGWLYRVKILPYRPLDG